MPGHLDRWRRQKRLAAPIINEARAARQQTAWSRCHSASPSDACAKGWLANAMCSRERALGGVKMRTRLEVETMRIGPRGSKWALRLYELFAPLRQSLEPYSEDQIARAVEEAVADSRARTKRTKTRQ